MSNKPLANWTTADGIPSTIADHVANSTARLAYAHFPGKTSFDSSDIGKVVMQDDDKSTWICTGISPLSWGSFVAKALQSATTVIDVVAATAPTTGQSLKSTSATAATWQDQAPTVANLTALTAYVATQGQWVYVTTQRVYYVAVATGLGEVAGVTGISWKRVIETSDPNWRTQATWFVSSAGSDEATGVDSSNPLLTTDEIRKRWGSMGFVKLGVSVTVTLMTNLTDLVSFLVEFTVRDLTFNVVGTPTATVNDTVATWTAATAGTYGSVAPHPSILVLTTNTTASLVGKRLHWTSVSNGPAYSMIGTANPSWGGTGAKSCSCTIPYTADTNNTYTTATAYVPPGSSAVVIETLPTIPALFLDINGDMDPNGLSADVLRVNGVSVTEDTTIETHGNTYCLFGATFTGALKLPAQAVPYNNIVSCNLVPQYCDLLDSSYIGCRIVGGTSLSAVRRISLKDCLCEGGTGLIFYFGSFGLTNLQVFGVTGYGISTWTGAMLTVFTSLSGTSNTTGGIRLRSGSSMWIDTTVTLNLITGGANPDVTIVSKATTLITYTWAQAGTGYMDGAWNGTSTLSTGGSVSVPVPNLDTTNQKILLSYNTPAAGATPLNAPAANRTATAFTVKGLSSDTTSTFDWSLTPLGDNIFITRSNANR